MCSCSGVLARARAIFCRALGQEMVNRGRRMKYTSCAMLVQDLLAAKRDLRLSREIKKLRQV